MSISLEFVFVSFFCFCFGREFHHKITSLLYWFSLICPSRTPSHLSPSFCLSGKLGNMQKFPGKEESGIRLPFFPSLLLLGCHGPTCQVALPESCCLLSPLTFQVQECSSLDATCPFWFPYTLSTYLSTVLFYFFIIFNPHLRICLLI